MARPGSSRLVLVAGVALLAAAASGPVADPDVGWVLRLGDSVLDGHLPRREEWSWTADGTPWTAHAWGAATVMSGLVQLLGLVPGLLLWQWLLVATTLAVLAVDGLRRHGRVAPVLSGCTAVLLGLFAFATPRTTLAGWPFLAAEAVWWHRAARGDVRRTPWWALVALQALWVNLHGSAVLGIAVPLALLAAVALTRTPVAGLRRELLRRAGWRTLGQLLSPYGVAGALHVGVVVGRSTDFIAEYQSPDLHSAGIFCTVVLTLLIAGWALVRATPAQALAAAGLLVAGLVSTRYLVVAVLVGAPLVLDAAAALRAPVRRRVPVAALVVLTVFATTATAAALTRPLSSADYPLGPARWLAEHPQAGRPLYNPYTAGGWLTWRARHGERVAQDGRNDVYPKAVLERLRDVRDVLPGWDDVLDPRAGITVVTGSRTALADRLSAQPGDWRRVYADDDWVVYEPVRPATRPLPLG